jgi:hypothetical protein
MSVPPFNSVNEVKKPLDKRRYHNNNKCGPGNEIPRKERREGDAGYRLCEHCKNLNAQARK